MYKCDIDCDICTVAVCPYSDKLTLEEIEWLGKALDEIKLLQSKLNYCFGLYKEIK